MNRIPTKRSSTGWIRFAEFFIYFIIFPYTHHTNLPTGTVTILRAHTPVQAGVPAVATGIEVSWIEFHDFNDTPIHKKRLSLIASKREMARNVDSYLDGAKRLHARFHLVNPNWT